MIVMNIIFDKGKCENIDTAFSALIENPELTAPTESIAKALESCFKGFKFSIQVIKPNDPSSMLFVMSVFPEVSTTDKMILAILNNEEDKIIEKIWKKNTNWVIEIDERIINHPVLQLTNRELTALLLHEVGHIVVSNSIPNRVSTVLRYEIAKSKLDSKMLLKNRVFRAIMSLPILDNCVSDKKKGFMQLNNEIKADNFSRGMGYSNELYKVLKKLSVLYSGTKSQNDIEKVTGFSLDTLSQLIKRRDNIAKSSLVALKESCQSPYITNELTKFIESIDADTDTAVGTKKYNMIHESIENTIKDGLYQEFSLFGTTKLKRIDPAELDYILIRMDSIESDSDKMMLISYLHSKLDTIDYYISILNNPSMSKKYSVPHSLDQLYHMRDLLEAYRMKILKYKIPDRKKGLLVQWAPGYEG